jgi:hypothetical protein
MEKTEKFLSRYYYLVIIILSLPAVWSLLAPGFYGASDDIHIAWLHQMDQVIKIGKIPPRYVPDLSFGFGYPLFNFVFPFPFYMAEIFHLLGLSYVTSIKAVFFLSVPLSMIFMYKLIRQFSNSFVGLSGAVIYAYTPFRATDLYVRGAIGEIVSFVFFPLLALSIIKLTKRSGKGNIRWIGIGAISVALIILAHNIAAYMFFPFILLLALFRLLVIKDRKRSIKKLLVSFSLGLLGSIYFWLPAILDSRLMKYDTIFDFKDHFPTIKQLILPYFGYGASVPGPGDGMSFFIGMVNLFLVIAGLFLVLSFWKKFNKDEKGLLLWSFVVFFIAVFMMNHRSTFLWENLPYLEYFQFPWRFLMLTTFVTPVFLVSFNKLKRKNYLVILMALVAFVVNFSNFKPQDFLLRKDGYFINRYIPVPYTSDEYKNTQEEYLRLPKENKERPNRVYPRFFTEEMQVIKNVEIVNSLDAKAVIQSQDEVVINYNKYNFPGWVAKIDSKSAEIKSNDPYGQVSLKVPSGKHEIEVSFQETDLKNELNLISLASFLIALFIAARFNWFKRLLNTLIK